MVQTRTLVCAALAAALAAAAAPAAEPPRVHAVVGARVVTAPGRTLAAATVVVRDGVIAVVGEGAEAPPDARVWDGKGLTLYPGLIDAYTVRAWPAAKDDKSQNGHPNGLVRAERDVAGLAADEAAFKKLREAGFTLALVAPKEGLFRGRSALVSLGSSELASALVRRGVAQHVALKPHQDDDHGYPGSLMGAVALFRQTLLDAAWQSAAQAAYARDPRQARPPLSPALAALEGAAAGRELVVFETEGVLDTLRDAGLARELGLRAWIVGNGHEYERLAEVRATGLPHILPLAYPKPPKPAGKEDPNLELVALRHWDRAPDNPKLVVGSGLEVAFTTFGLDEPGKLHENLQRAIERGLTADQALAALTVAPARLLGIADRAGTIEAGKMADFVEVEGDLFVDKPKIRAVWIDGERHEVKASKPAEVDPVGRWSLTAKTPDGQTIPVTLEVAGKSGAWTGTIAAMDQQAGVDALDVSGKKLTVTFAGTPFGQAGTITFTIEIEGDTASGSGEAPSGPFEISGSRTPERGGEDRR